MVTYSESGVDISLEEVTVSALISKLKDTLNYRDVITESGHFAGVAVASRARTAGSVTVAETSVVQILASRTLIVYVAAARPLNVPEAWYVPPFKLYS